MAPSAPAPSQPLRESYTYHSPKPTAAGPYILGVDEAGRGPVLGPLVYGVAYCPVSYTEQLDELGFADSKALTPETRAALLDTLCSDPTNLGWSVRVVCPQAISSGMLRRPPTNLNRQSEEATVLLIREVLDSGIKLSEVYVDALGSTKPYEAYLSSLFPGIDFTVTTKADSKFKIVGAASIAAKVTRDACIDGWTFEELDGTGCELELVEKWSKDVGSGYPSDPKTQAWLKNHVEPTFGFPKFVRFSWTTVKLLLEKEGHRVKWTDEGQASLKKAFETGQGRDKDRCSVTKDLQLTSISFENLARVDGSARFALGKTGALASVSGPIEARLSAENPSQATFDVHLRPLSGVPATDARSLSSSIRSALLPSLILTQHPRTLIQLVLLPLSQHRLTGIGSDHALAAALVNASTLALINAGSIPMRGIVTAVSVGLSTSTRELVVDPDEDRLSDLVASGCFAFFFADGDTQCVWVDWKNVTSPSSLIKVANQNDINRARELALGAAREIRDEMKRQIVHMGKKIQMTRIPPPPSKQNSIQQKSVDLDDDKMEI